MFRNRILELVVKKKSKKNYFFFDKKVIPFLKTEIVVKQNDWFLKGSSKYEVHTHTHIKN